MQQVVYNTPYAEAPLPPPPPPPQPPPPPPHENWSMPEVRTLAFPYLGTREDGRGLYPTDLDCKSLSLILFLPLRLTPHCLVGPPSYPHSSLPDEALSSGVDTQSEAKSAKRKRRAEKKRNKKSRQQRRSQSPQQRSPHSSSHTRLLCVGECEPGEGYMSSTSPPSYTTRESSQSHRHHPYRSKPHSP